MDVVRRPPIENPSLWHNHAYVLLFSGQTISMLGSYIEIVTLPPLILAISHSPAQAGLVSGLYALASFVGGIPIGVFVDRWNRKREGVVRGGGVPGEEESRDQHG